MAAAILLAHGAGAPSSSPWMQRYLRLLAGFATVHTFDYPYLRAGRRAPDRLPNLIQAHREELARFRAMLESDANPPGATQVLLAGKSMGGRVGCHVALEEVVGGLVCFGYPLRGQNGALRDQVLLSLGCPVLFVQGTRDALCSLPELDAVRKRMKAPSELFIVEGGDHSLEATKTSLKERRTTQVEVERLVAEAVKRFAEAL